MDEAKLRKIRALLDRAAHENTPQAEAEAATAKAMELMAEYGISEAMVDAAGPRKDEIVTRRFGLSRPYTYEKMTLLANLGYALRCQSMTTRFGSVYDSVTLVGYASDIERVDMLFTSLLLQATRDLMRAKVPYYENTTTFRKNWLTGFTTTACSRVRAIERAAVRDHDRASSTGSAELVLADRSALVKRAYEDQFPKLKKFKSRDRSGAGLHEGYEAGRRADVGQTRVHSAQRRAVAGGGA